MEIAMSKADSAYPNARVPYGTWGSTYFPAWQTSPFAELNFGQFAGETLARILGLRGVSRQHLDYLVTGSTIPWRWKFWNSPFVAHCMGERLAGCHVEQACATGLQASAIGAAEVQAGAHQVVAVLGFDRTSDSAVGVFPERRTTTRTAALVDVWDNFGFDPSTGGSMLAAAGATARKHQVSRKEVDEVALCRYQQYFETKARGFHERYMVPVDVLNTSGKVVGRVAEDLGVKPITAEGLRAMTELDTSVTSGGQTHAADGVATLLVTSKERAAELSARPEITIRLIAKADVRMAPGMMPEAPSFATRKLLGMTGLGINDMAVVKSHNPFAVNDAVFAKVLGYPWQNMNRTGSSLVWGHPQGPTMVRIIIEALEEAVELGGGYVLVTGCAAGDVGVAAIFEVA
jgi:acetyl-CoA acetyltransferase